MASTSHQQVHANPTVYRHIPEGNGGTYTFTSVTPAYIGTSKCKTCVGVYFAIDDTRCFFAHINVDLTKKFGSNTYETNWATAAKIREAISRRLHEEQQRSQWGPVSDRMRNSLVMVCLEPAVKWRSQVGEAVSRAVWEWLQFTIPQLPRRCGAFIVQRPSGKPEYFDLEPSNTVWHKQDEPEQKGWGMLIDRVEKD